MNKRIGLVIIVLLVLGAACGTAPSTNQPENTAEASSGEVAAATATATLPASSPTPESGETADTGELPPLNLEEVLQAGVDADDWTYEEGLVLIIKFLLNQADESDIPGITEVAVKSGTWIVQRAKEYIQRPDGDPETQAELARLLDILFIPQEVLDKVSRLDQEAGNLPSAVHQAALTSPDKNAQNQKECMDLVNGVYDQFPENTLCFLYRERQVNGRINVRVYFPTWSDYSTEILPSVNIALETLEETARLYDSFSGLEMKDYSLIFMPPEARTYSTTNLPEISFPDVCFTLINPDEFSGSKSQQQKIARDMFNCVIRWSFDGTDIFWWYQGASLYFSNVAYPFGDIEKDVINHFDVRSTTVSIDNMEEENFVFFQFLGNVYGPQTVVNILDIINRGDITSLFNYISPESPGSFSRFVVNYLSSGIADENTGAYFRSPSPPRVTDTITVDKVGEYKIDSGFLVARRYYVDYKKEKRFLQKKTWNELPDIIGVQADLHPNLSAWSSLPPEIRSSCENDIRYLYVPQTDMYFHEISFTVTTAQQAVCDPCLLGTWLVFKSSFQEYMTSIFEEQVPGVSGFQFAISGDYYLQFDTEGKFQAQRKDLTVVAGIGQIDYPIQPTLNPNSPGPQPTENGSFDLSFTPMVTTIINSNGIGNYWADGKTMKISQFVDGLESAQISGGLTFTHGFFSSLQSGGDAFESAMSSNPESTNANVDQEESAPYFCQGDALEITMPYTGSILQLYRVDQILPDPIPFFSPYYKEP